MSDEQGTFADLLEADEREFASQWTANPARTDAEVRMDWLLERIGRRRGQVERNDAVARVRKDMIEDWRRGENDRLERGIAWLEGEVRQLIPHNAIDFEREYGKRSRNLPHGTIGFKKHPDRVEVYSEEKALAWAKVMGLPIAIKESVSKTELKKALDAGAEPDGVELIRGLDEFYVRLDGQATHQDKE